MNETPSSILKSIDELTDLFRRRLLNDKVQAQTISGLLAQLNGQQLAPLCREFILMIDRAENYEDDTVRSFSEETFAILSHYGLERIARSDTAFSPAIQKVVEVRDIPDTPPNTIIGVVRDGYVLNGAVIRPQEVIIAGKTSGSTGKCAQAGEASCTTC